MAIVLPATDPTIGMGTPFPSIATYTTAGGASGTHTQIVHVRPDSSAIVPRLSSTSINSATSGNNTLVTGIAGTTIRVMGLFIGSTGPQLWRLKSGTLTTLWPDTPTAGGPLVLPITGEPYVTTTAGGDLIIFQSTSVQVSGRIYFTQS
jgi:hypothetical protein